MLELSHIQKSFDGTPVLKDISLCVQNGEIVSIAKARQILLEAGADDVLLNLAQLPDWLLHHN